ncbi:hypothetical protein HSBAA_54540 [Vreelandella sulfidaeris]|uniref:Uncharacterized protein n=1 Tax=Vreelandella sulfidaeris TaxID=115553 RepID=A0A455UIG3_9GAMM|nr:hypothetical protein HSBAA_54540 [Halomonas sulfidaeris]
MTNNAIDIHSEVARGSSGYAQIPDVTMLQTKMTTLGNILSRYGGLGSEALDKLSAINLKSMEFKRNQNCILYAKGGRKYL